jgi:hypothetical protein
MKKVLIGLVLVLSLSSLPAFSANTPKAGSACNKKGITKTHKGIEFKCLKKGGKLVWSKGKGKSKEATDFQDAPTTSAPSPVPTLTSNPLASPSPLPSPSPKVLKPMNLNLISISASPESIQVSWQGFENETDISNFRQVNIYVVGNSFGDGLVPTARLKKPETISFEAKPGLYLVLVKIEEVNGSETISIARALTVKEKSETIDIPQIPTGFSSERLLGGIEVIWEGTYSENKSWSGFKAVNIYAGNSPQLIPGSYIKVGEMTANLTRNAIVVGVDSKYVRYNAPVYIHASASTAGNPSLESSISPNVTRQLCGARSAIASSCP